MNPQVQQLIDDLALDLKEAVAQIEASLETTQHHYGDYGALISQLANGRKPVALVIGHALIKAGANPIGVANAIKLFV